MERARAVADLAEGMILATVEISAPPERVFRALCSEEIVKWWVRPGVFDTREWTGDVRVGGRWRASGIARGQPYTLEGEFLEVERPHRLVHTWHSPASPAVGTVVTYTLEPVEGGTRLTLRHTGLASREIASNTSMGWESSCERLVEVLGGPA